MTNADRSTNTFFPLALLKVNIFSSGDCKLWTISHKEDSVLMAVRNTILHHEIAGYEPLQSSHHRDHQKIAGYCAGYGPLQNSYQGDHHEIAGRRLWTSSEFLSEYLKKMQMGDKDAKKM